MEVSPTEYDLGSPREMVELFPGWSNHPPDELHGFLSFEDQFFASLGGPPLEQRLNFALLVGSDYYNNRPAKYRWDFHENPQKLILTLTDRMIRRWGYALRQQWDRERVHGGGRGWTPLSEREIKSS